MNKNLILNFKDGANTIPQIEELRVNGIPIDDVIIRCKNDSKKDLILTIEPWIFNCSKITDDLWVVNIQKQVQVDDKLLTLGEMASSIFHELNTPLGISIASLELFKMDLEDVSNTSVKQTLESHLANLETGLTRMIQISEGIHNFCRNTQDQYNTVNLTVLLDQVLSYYGHLLHKNQIKISIKIDSEISDFNVVCKHALISQVFVNLLKNAKDALESQSVFNKWIKVEFYNRQDSVEIRFIDGGPGIPMNIQNKIFDHFFTTKEIGKGTGIGLSFCKKVISQHNGSLTIDNSIKNTCFTINLPKKQIN